MPTLSIIIPVYNAERFLEECIKSILEQSYQDYELILINDGSIDNSKIICDRFADQNDRITVHNLLNGGASKARNEGICKASGRYIWFIDADDWIEKDFLYSIDWANMPDILFFGFKRILKDHYEVCSIPDYIIENSNNIGNTLNNLFTSKEQFLGYTWNKIFKKSIIEENKIRFRENLIIKEDEVFTLEYCKHIKSIRILQSTPYNYRILSDSLSHSQKKKRNMLELVTFLETDLKDSKYPEILRTSLLKALIFYYKEALIEKMGDPEITSIFRKYVNYLKSNKNSITLSKKDRFFLKIPSNLLKRKLFYFHHCLNK